MAAYGAATREGPESKIEVGASKTVAGTINAVVVSYYRSSDFLALRPITKSTYRNVMERFRAEHGDKPVAKLEREHVKRIMGKLADRPSAANQWLKIVRLLMRHAVDNKLRKDNPTLGIKKLKTPPGGWTTWNEEDIGTFRRRHPTGSAARLAFELLLNTGQRRQDVVRMGRQHVKDGVISVRQSKTGMQLWLPVHADLQRELASIPSGRLTFLLTEEGKSFSAAGFGNWFHDRVVDAGLPRGRSPHGLRKAMCRRLAEAGCTAPQIMAVSGHKTLSEAQKYIEEANKATLAQEAMATITTIGTRT